MKLKIITPEQTLYSNDNVILVQLPGVDGLFEILNRHAPLMAVLGKGAVKVEEFAHKVSLFNIDGGMVEVKDNEVVILVD